jgi:hypothetical protein
MDEEASSEAIASSVFGLEEMPSNFRGKNATQEALRKSKQTTHATANSMLQAMNCGVDTQVEPAFMHTLNTNPDLPTMIYYTRRYVLTCYCLIDVILAHAHALLLMHVAKRMMPSAVQ